MYIQSRILRAASGDIRSILKKAAEEFLPVLKEIPGFVDYMTIDLQDGRVMSLTICDTKEGLEESRKNALEWGQKNAPELSLLEVIEGEIVFQAKTPQKPEKKVA